jgi:hypothetical protein
VVMTEMVTTTEVVTTTKVVTITKVAMMVTSPRTKDDPPYPFHILAFP